MIDDEPWMIFWIIKKKLNAINKKIFKSFLIGSHSHKNLILKLNRGHILAFNKEDIYYMYYLNKMARAINFS